MMNAVVMNAAVMNVGVFAIASLSFCTIKVILMAVAVVVLLLCHDTVVWGDSLLCVCLFFVCFFVRLRISQRRKKMGMKPNMLVRLLSAQVFSHFGDQRSRLPGTKKCA